MTEEERIRATARRVGLDTPMTYDGSEKGYHIKNNQSLNSTETNQEEVKQFAPPGPLKPPV